MPIDPRIALGYQPPQIESPVNMMMLAQKMQAGQQENALRQAQMQNYQSEIDRRNALLQFEIAKAERDAAAAGDTARKAKLERAAKKTEVYMGDLPNYASDPDSLGQWLTMQHNDPDMAGTPVHDQPLDVLLSKIPRDPQAFATHVQQTALGMSKWIESNKPTIHAQNLGDSVRLVGVPGLSGPAFEVPGSRATVNLSPAAAAREQRLANAGINEAKHPLLAQAFLAGRVPVARINSRIANFLEEALQIKPDADIVKLYNEQISGAAGARTAGTTQANIRIASNEAREMMDVVRETSANVDRTQYPTINAISNAVSRGTGGPEIVQLNTAINALVNSYARAINPRGMPTVSDKNHAREIINSAYSQGQLGGILDIMEREMQAAGKAANAPLPGRGQAGGESAAPAPAAASGLPSQDAVAAEIARRNAGKK